MSDDIPMLRIGTRASALARWQAEWVKAALEKLGTRVELVPITTRGDADQTTPLETLGEPGLFTKELQRALLDRRIDVAVHSLKDLPTDAIEGLSLAAVPSRGPTEDVLVTVDGRGFDELPYGANIGTGSLRRRTQLWHARPDLKMNDIRGNVDTRLEKLRKGAYDALVLAKAGLVRLELAARERWPIPSRIMLPAVGQGVLGIEARAEDSSTLNLLAPLDDAVTHASVLAERSLLAALRGGCMAPIAAWCRPDADRDGKLRLDAVVLSGDGKRRLASFDTDVPEEARALGQRVAGSLVSQGAPELIAESRG